jgi:hypothetical protein
LRAPEAAGGEALRPTAPLVTFRPLAADESRHAGLVCHAEVHFESGLVLDGLTVWLDRKEWGYYVRFPIGYDGDTADLQRVVVDAYLEQSCYGLSARSD